MRSIYYKIAPGIIVLALLPGVAAAEKLLVGDAAAVVRSVEGIYESDIRTLKRADEVFFTEVIATKEDSASKIRFADDTLLTIGPASKVAIDAFVYDPNGKNSKMVVNATLGVARFVTGKMGSAAYQIKTPTATIGVRGTILTVSVEEDGTTSTVVEDGAVFVQGEAGEPVEVGEGLATTTAPGEEPTEPAPPTGDTETEVAEMDVTLLLDGGEQGGNDSVTEEGLTEIVEEVEQMRAAGCGC